MSPQARLITLHVILFCIASCTSNPTTPPAPAVIASAPESVVTESTQPAPEVAPAVIEPTPLERAQQALTGGHYDEVCTYLVSVGFSDIICAWIADTARSSDDHALSSARLERFLRDQHVRRVSGSIVGFYDEANNDYEVRVAGRIAILEATETSFETTGRFTLWAQQHGTRVEVLTSGREVSVPIYREWPLASAILEMARARGDDAGPAAWMLLQELLRSWESSYCYAVDGSCFVAAAQ
jgi:hypothetical protein